MRSTYNFGPASPDEQIVFGANRPGYHSEDPEKVPESEVEAWIAAMISEQINRVVCLLHDEQLAFYTSVPGGLLARYRHAFGQENVLHARVEDYHLIDTSDLERVIDFLLRSEASGTRVVVHCSGGSGRTGHVLAAWLVHGRGHDVREALRIASQARNPREAVNCGNATEAELIGLLQRSTV